MRFCHWRWYQYFFSHAGNFSRESFKYSSLFCSLHTGRIHIRPSSRTLLLLLLLTCGDIETFPGPGNIEEITKPRGLKIIHQNCRGLFKSLDNFIASFSKQNNIIVALSETHIESQSIYDNNSLYEIPGFSFIKRNRSKEKGGGVAMYIPNNVIWDHREDLQNAEIECIWVEICSKMAKSFLIGCLYRPPDSSCYLSRNWKDAFSDMLTKVGNNDKETILLGDFDVNYMKNKYHREEKDMIASHGFKQRIKDPTRVTSDSNPLIDVLLSNKPSNISKTPVVPLSISDHDCIAHVRKLNNAKIPSREVTSPITRTMIRTGLHLIFFLIISNHCTLLQM